MKLKFEIKTIYGEVAFSYEKENNSIKETVEKFLEKNKGKWIQQINLSNLNLSGIDFIGSKFYNSKFSNSEFDNSKFSNSIFYNSEFDNSKFYNSEFDNSEFDNSKFSNSKFSNSKFSNSKFSNSKFYNSKFSNSEFRKFIYNGVKVKRIASFIGLYKYDALVIISEENEVFIKMGCYFRKKEEWDRDFWNNTYEFPNDKSIKSELRKFAYETACKWAKLMKDL